MNIRLYMSIAVLFLLVLYVGTALATDPPVFEAVIVGIEDYPGSGSDLNYCVDDANDIKNAFINEWGYPNANIEYLINTSASESAISGAIDNLPTSSVNVCFFTFSGHGDSDEIGTSDGVIPANSLSARYTPTELYNDFGSTYNHYACFIDACGSGCFPDHMSKGVISSACAAHELSWEYGAIQNGVYSYYLASAINGAADDPYAEDFHTYLDSRVEDYDINRDQDPEISDNFTGDLELVAEPVEVYITGPSFLEYKEFGTYVAHPSMGYTPYTYQWYKQNEGSETWMTLHTSSTEVIRMARTSFTVKVVVTDAGGNTDYDTHFVSSEGEPKLVGNRVVEVMPEEFDMNQNYPNPFNPSTTIKFGLPEDSPVKLQIFNLQGQVVTTLVEGNLPAGFHTATFEASSLSSGVYFYKIVAGNFTDIKRMLLIK